MAIKFLVGNSWQLMGDGTSTSMTVGTTSAPTSVEQADISGGPGGFTITSTSYNTLLKTITVNFSSAPPAGYANAFGLIAYYTTTDTRTIVGVVYSVQL